MQAGFQPALISVVFSFLVDLFERLSTALRFPPQAISGLQAARCDTGVSYRLSRLSTP